MRNLIFLIIFTIGCGETTSLVVPDHTRTKSAGGKADSSVEAVFLTFQWEGELWTRSSYNLPKQVEKQLLFTIGQLNGDRSVGRLDQVDLDILSNESVNGGRKITYSASMPVAWGKPNSVPNSYDLIMPVDISYDGNASFTEKYKDSCVDWSAHDVDVDSMWYYYRPDAYNCNLDQEDVLTFTADVSVSEINTTGKYPEYHKVWEDDVLKVVAVFGKYEDGATTASDAGISAYNKFVRQVKQALAAYDLVTVPEDLPYSPGVATPDVTLTADLGDGKSVQVVAMLVDNVRAYNPTFNARYEELSGSADLIAYNGHSGLGANIRALANKGSWVTGQYAIVFLNGCDTYAYVDSALADAHMNVNSDDSEGTKYLDIVTNAMPAYFASDAPATMAFIKALMAYEQPRTYEQIFANVDSAQVVLVSGEQDNVYVPGYDGGGTDPDPEQWDGMQESGTVLQDEEIHFETPVLAQGEYIFELSGSGDADLYIRIGDAPTLSLYDCRPYRWGSDETCVVGVPSAAKVHVMVVGWDAESDFELVGFEH